MTINKKLRKWAVRGNRLKINKIQMYIAIAKLHKSISDDSIKSHESSNSRIVRTTKP